jgi:hypothetical protein
VVNDLSFETVYLRRIKKRVNGEYLKPETNAFFRPNG